MSLVVRAVLVIVLVGCTGTDAVIDTEPPPPPLTTRFVADAYLQDCRWSGEDWLGVESMDLVLEHDLDGPIERELPSAGTCVDGLELFGEEALRIGDDLPGLVGRPLFQGPLGGGSLADLVPGLWYTTAFTSPERCGTLEESVGDGLVLTEAGAVSGLATPATATLSALTVDGGRFNDRAAAVQVGDPVALAWEAEGWDEAFVQVRRLHDGEARQTITCGATGLDSFTVGDSAWDLVNDAIFAQDIEVYVGLVRRSEVELEDGSARATVVTRAIHVLKP